MLVLLPSHHEVWAVNFNQSCKQLLFAFVDRRAPVNRYGLGKHLFFDLLVGQVCVQQDLKLAVPLLTEHNSQQVAIVD